MADDDNGGGEFAQPGKGRSAYGNLQSRVYTDSFKQALDELST